MSILSGFFKRHTSPVRDWQGMMGRYLQTGERYLSQCFNPTTTELIVVDAQKGYCEPCMPFYRMTEDQKDYHCQTRTTLNRIAEFSADLDKADIRQIWLRHTVQFTAKFFGQGIEHYSPALDDAKLAEFIRTANDLCFPVDPDRIIDKPACSGFFNTSLDERLKAENTRTVLIAGGMRRACVYETAMAAKDRFMTFIVDDLTIADTSQLTIDNRAKDAADLNYHNIHTVTSDQVRKIMAGSMSLHPGS